MKKYYNLGPWIDPDIAADYGSLHLDLPPMQIQLFLSWLYKGTGEANALHVVDVGGWGIDISKR